MFFIWLIKNKNFKKGSSIKAQATPLLIAVMVTMVIAALVTINIGRIALDKTYSSNASDACSLAAGSYWASAINYLTKYNEEILESYYDMNYYTYGLLYEEADGYIDEAIMYALAGTALAVVASKLIKPPPGAGTVVTPWAKGLEASIIDLAAAYLILQSSMAVSAFEIVVSYMLSLTESFHEQQWEFYCNARDYMDDTYIASEKAGISYAFSNSGISSKLSKDQNNEFSTWMTDTAPWLSDSGPYNEGAYTWNDSLDQEHKISVNLDLPNITSYELQHTVGSYSDITDLLEDLIDRAEVIASVLYSMSTTLGATGAILAVGFVYSVIAVMYMSCCGPHAIHCCILWGVYSKKTFAVWADANSKMAKVVLTLEVIIGLAGALSVYLLRSDNDEAYEDWGVDGVQSSSSCDDAADLMIVKIYELTLPKWTTQCCETQTHPSASEGIIATKYPEVTSCSTARFDGGSIGDFEATYDSHIEGAN